MRLQDCHGQGGGNISAAKHHRRKTDNRFDTNVLPLYCSIAGLCAYGQNNTAVLHHRRKNTAIHFEELRTSHCNNAYTADRKSALAIGSQHLLPPKTLDLSHWVD